MGECLQSRLDKLGQMRVLDMHAHLAFLTGSETEKWEQKKMAAYEAGKKELDFRYQNGIATCLSSGTPAEWVYTRQFQNREELLLSFGIHPWYADQPLTEKMQEAYSECDYIGEIGMDSVWCDIPLDIQQKRLEEQLQIAADLKKPVLLHTKGRRKGLQNCCAVSRIISVYTGIPVPSRIWSPIWIWAAILHWGRIFRRHVARQQIDGCFVDFQRKKKNRNGHYIKECCRKFRLSDCL